MNFNVTQCVYFRFQNISISCRGCILMLHNVYFSGFRTNLFSAPDEFYCYGMYLFPVSQHKKLFTAIDEFTCFCCRTNIFHAPMNTVDAKRIYFFSRINLIVAEGVYFRPQIDCIKLRSLFFTFDVAEFRTRTFVRQQYGVE